MGWVADIFKKKPGGSFFGNLIRTIADVYTGGIYSTINPVRPCSNIPLGGKVTQLFPTSFGMGGDTSQQVPVESNPYGGGNAGGPSGFIHNVTQSGNIMGINFGCNDGNNSLYRQSVATQRGLGIALDFPDLSDVLNLDTSTQTPTYTSGTIVNTTSTNPFNLPTNVLDAITDVASTLSNGQIDLNNIGQTAINLIDSAIGNNMPPQVTEATGLDENLNVVIPEAVNNWSVGGQIGGVDFNIGDNKPKPQEPKENFFNKVVEWLQTKTGLITVALTIAIIVTSIFLYKKYR